MTPEHVPLTDAVDDNITINLPSWAKVVAQVGAPIVFAGALLWMFNAFVRDVDAEVKKNTATLERHASATDTIKQSLDQQQQNQLIMIDVLRQQCVIMARTPDAREACFRHRGDQ